MNIIKFYFHAPTCTAAGKLLNIDHYFLSYKGDGSKSILSSSLRNFVLKISHAYSLCSKEDAVGNISCLVFNIHRLPDRLSCTIGPDSLSLCSFQSLHAEYSFLNILYSLNFWNVLVEEPISSCYFPTFVTNFF